MAMGKVTKSFKVTLDIARSISNREFSVVEGDTGNALSITLNDDGKAVDLTGCRVLALFSKSNGETVCQDSAEQNGGVTIGGQSMNEISIELFASSVAPGMVESEIQVSRGMGASTYVSSMKEREDDDVQSDISIMEAQYTATLAERIAAALEKYQSMSLQAQLQNAQYAYNAQTTAMNLASQWFNSYMNNAARAVKGSGGRSGKSGTASKNMSTLDYVRFVSGLSAPERSMLYNSGASEWVMMRTELEDALGKDGYRTVRSAFPILGSAGVKSISNKNYDKARDTWRWAR